MKRLILMAACVLAAGTLAAQNCIIVDSEQIFKSLDEYNTAIDQLDELARNYQQQVDDRFKEVEQMYNGYMAQKASLPAATRQVYEQQILDKEREAQEFQEGIFGQEGTLMKKRLELIQPIQKRVFDAIESYAAQVGAAAVIDSSNNPTLLYAAPSAEHTQQVIEILKQ